MANPNFFNFCSNAVTDLGVDKNLIMKFRKIPIIVVKTK